MKRRVVKRIKRSQKEARFSENSAFADYAKRADTKAKSTGDYQWLKRTKQNRNRPPRRTHRKNWKAAGHTRAKQLKTCERRRVQSRENIAARLSKLGAKHATKQKKPGMMHGTASAHFRKTQSSMCARTRRKRS